MVTRVWKRVKLDLLEPPAGDFHVLNGMRGLSAYLVVCFHAAIFSGNFPLTVPSKPELVWFHRAINGFWVGLDVFFVLSGFLIGRLLMLSLRRTGTVEFLAFFTRRSMRIFPAYYLVLTLAIFWYTRYDIGHTWFFLGDADWSELLGTSWQNYTYTVNYFFQAGTPNAMAWSWSLCVEEHFYIMLPLALALIFRYASPERRPAILWGLTLLPLGVRAAEYLANPDIVLLDGFYFRTHNRVDEVMYGVLAAYYYVHHYDAFAAAVKRVGNGMWAIGFLLIGAVWLFGGLQRQGLFAVVFQFNLMALGATFLLVNGLFLDNGITRFFAHRAWYPVARVSYGIYLTHSYVLFVVLKYFGLTDARDLGSLDFFLFFACVMILTTLVAAFMFVTFERPLIDYGRRLSRRFRHPDLVDTTTGPATPAPAA